MIIQAILCAGLGFALFYAWLQRRKSRLVSLAIMLVAAAGIVAVLAPDASTEIANILGVGRGADLVMYCWIVITLLVAVSLQFKILQIQRSLTVMTRELAIRAPILPPGPLAGGAASQPGAGLDL